MHVEPRRALALQERDCVLIKERQSDLPGALEYNRDDPDK